MGSGLGSTQVGPGLQGVRCILRDRKWIWPGSRVARTVGLVQARLSQTKIWESIVNHLCKELLQGECFCPRMERKKYNNLQEVLPMLSHGSSGFSQCWTYKKTWHSSCQAHTAYHPEAFWVHYTRFVPDLQPRRSDPLMPCTADLRRPGCCTIRKCPSWDEGGWLRSRLQLHRLAPWRSLSPGRNWKQYVFVELCRTVGKEAVHLIHCCSFHPCARKVNNLWWLSHSQILFGNKNSKQKACFWRQRQMLTLNPMVDFMTSAHKKTNMSPYVKTSLLSDFLLTDLPKGIKSLTKRATSPSYSPLSRMGSFQRCTCWHLEFCLKHPTFWCWRHDELTRFPRWERHRRTWPRRLGAGRSTRSAWRGTQRNLHKTTNFMDVCLFVFQDRCTSEMMRRRSAERRVNAKVEWCVVISQCHGNCKTSSICVLFSTLALVRRACEGHAWSRYRCSFWTTLPWHAWYPMLEDLFLPTWSVENWPLSFAWKRSVFCCCWNTSSRNILEFYSDSSYRSDSMPGSLSCRCWLRPWWHSPLPCRRQLLPCSFQCWLSALGQWCWELPS